MTIQEAIQTIQKMLEVYTSECRTLMSYQITALEMAIEALSCSEEPNRSDLISRSDAIDALSRGSGCGNSCRRAIEHLPSAQPEHPLLKIIKDFKEMTGCEDVLVVQKDAMKAWDENGVAYTMQPERKGEWIDRNGNIVSPFWERYECSECGARSDNTNYCPNCGRKMKGKGGEK